MPTLFSWGGNVLWDQKGMHWLCSLYFPSCISGRSRQYHGWTGKGQRKKQLSSSAAVCTRCHSYIKTLVRALTWAVFIYRWSDLQTNHPIWKYWLLWSTPIHEQPAWQQSLVNALKGPGMNSCLVKKWDNNGDWRNGFYELCHEVSILALN